MKRLNVFVPFLVLGLLAFSVSRPILADDAPTTQPAAKSVAVKLVDLAGTPVPGATLILSGGSPDGMKGDTDDQGNYTFTSLADGRYDVYFIKKGLDANVSTTAMVQSGAGVFVTLKMRTTQPAPADAKTIVVKIVDSADAPVAGATVTLRRGGGHSTKVAQGDTDDHGVFTFANVNDNFNNSHGCNYVIVFAKKGYGNEFPVHLEIKEGVGASITISIGSGPPSTQPAHN